MGKRWPSEDVFTLSDLATLAKVRNTRGEWIGVYQGPDGPLVGAGRSPRALARRLKRASLGWPVFVRRARSRGELPVRIEADKPDHFISLMQGAYRAIAEARKIVHNSMGFHPEAEVKRARDFLRDLGNECRNKGEPRGDSPTAAENQRMLRLFLLCSTGNKTLKEIAFEMEPTKRPDSLARSLPVQMKRFSRRVHAAVSSHYGEDENGQVPAGFLQHEKAWGRLSSIFGSIERWPGVKSNCYEHGYALCEALRRYKPTKAELLRLRRP